jgi:hypothetical protein
MRIFKPKLRSERVSNPNTEEITPETITKQPSTWRPTWMHSWLRIKMRLLTRRISMPRRKLTVDFVKL